MVEKLLDGFQVKFKKEKSRIKGMHILNLMFLYLTFPLIVNWCILRENLTRFFFIYRKKIHMVTKYQNWQDLCRQNIYQSTCLYLHPCRRYTPFVQIHLKYPSQQRTGKIIITYKLLNTFHHSKQSANQVYCIFAQSQC